MHTVTDKVLVSSSVVQASAAVFKTMKPFLDYISRWRVAETNEGGRLHRG